MGEKSSAANMNDIPAKYSSEINYLINHQIITGYPDKTFKPNNNVTREEAVTMIGRAIGLNGQQRATSYDDVKKESFGSGYIQSAFEKELLKGVFEKSFKPKEKITRGEMTFLLSRAFQLTVAEDVFFSDVPRSGSQYDAINAIVNAGIGNGYPDGTFKPGNAITRAEFSLLVARGLEPTFRVSSSDLVPEGEFVVTADSLNVRSGPGTEFSILGSLPLGTKVISYKTEGDWVFAEGNQIKGYLHKAYLSKPSTSNKIIAIDAGHGGTDPGAYGNGVTEKELNLAVALLVQEKLEKNGIQVFMTRTDDTFVPLADRVSKSVKANADTFVSIHGNSNTSSSPNGTETYYSTAALNTRAENSKKLAGFIQERLHKALGTSDRGIKQAGFHVIHKNPLPSVLVELGFLSNAGDAKKLASDEYREKAAEAITEGIIDYYNWKN